MIVLRFCFKRFHYSHRESSTKKGAARNFVKFMGRHMCWGFFFNKVATLLKRDSETGFFPVNFAKFL